MKKSILAIILMMMFSVMAFASGGGDGDQVNKPWGGVDDEACALFTPAVLTSDKCVPDPDGVSGQDYFCTFLAVCPAGIPEEDEESES